MGHLNVKNGHSIRIEQLVDRSDIRITLLFKTKTSLGPLFRRSIARQ